MGKPSDHPRFKTLKRQWDEILKETGFEDIEDELGRLRQYSRGIYSRYGASNLVQLQAREQFWRRLTQCVAQAHFDDKLERYVMERYAEGKKQIEIQERLEAIGHPKHRTTIYLIVHKWLTLWNLK